MELSSDLLHCWGVGPGFVVSALSFSGSYLADRCEVADCSALLHLDLLDGLRGLGAAKRAS